MANVVEMREITKVFSEGNLRAVDNVSIDLRQGEILCLAGENGAGKTTLMSVLYGLVPPTAGETLVRGKPAHIHSPLDANRLGIGMVHQHFMLFPEFTVAQNVVMGIEPSRLGLLYDDKEAQRQVAQVIEAHHFSVTPDQPVKSLTVGQCQQVEILKMLYRNVEILILDEPTAVLTEQEIDALFKTFRALVASGKSLILITHKLREIKEISHRVAVMRKGQLVAVRDSADLDLEELSRLMVGREVDLRIGGGGAPPDAEPVLRFENVSLLRRNQERPILDHVSFEAHPGEILGFAGVGGNGLDALEAVLGGLAPISEGRIFHRDEDISRLDARRLRQRGLAYVPADRLRVGSAGEATVAENIIVGRRRRLTHRGFLDAGAITSFARDLLDQYDVRGGPEQSIRSLSGGNIQKVILAREIEGRTDYIIFSEPTWGLDVAASRYVYEQMAALRDSGAAVLLISSNLDEILINASRILVFYRGAVAAEFRVNSGDAPEALKEEIGAYMLGLKTEAAHG